jgi:quercetin dioxygenase-like cupin family protein
MRLPALVVLSSVMAGTFAGGVSAQYAERDRASRYPAEWENDLFRVRRIAIAPRAQAATEADDDRVLVFLSAGLDGRMPAADAVFQPRGSRPLENLGGTLFEAISIGLKDGPESRASATPPEAVPLTDDTDVRTLIDNPRVIVLKVRYRSTAYGGPQHFHPKDALVIYLGRGYTWAANGMWGSYRVSRGDIDLVPAHTLHSFGNAGSDPLDVLVIVPK